ncbi:MAG: L-sorbosone dehydrogenase [Labilithrix sp.]|nr:L-sorbosone dehydrogenase [Labilithrix sp.]
MSSRVVAAGALLLVVGPACTNDKAAAVPPERGHGPTSAAIAMPKRGAPACGPRGLPPDRHFVAEGLCARVMAHKQGALRGITFAPNGDLFAVTAEGEIRRYRDVDRDGVYAPGPPESTVWATTDAADGDDDVHDCRVDAAHLYCASKSGVKRWRYEADLDRGGAGEDVIAAIPDRGRHATHPLSLWDGFVYAASGAGDVRRFAVEKLVAGKPMPWKDGELVAHGTRNVAAMARDPRGHLIGIEPDGADERGAPIVGLDPANVEHPMSFVQPHASALGLAFAHRDGAFALAERWRSGAFVALHGSSDRDASTGHKVIWIPFDANGATRAEYETVFGGGKYRAARDGEWSWKLGDAGENPVRPVGVALSPIDGALYVSSDNAGGAPSASSGSIYRIALLGK